MQFKIEFNADYEGKAKDVARTKFRAFLTALLFGLAAIVLGIIVAYVRLDGSYIYRWTKIGGIVLIAGGVIGVVGSPIIGLTLKYNDGFFETVRFVFGKNPDDNEWGFVLTTNKHGKPFEDSGYVNMVDIKSGVAALSTNRGKRYYVPLSQLTDEQRTAFEDMANEIKQKRIRATVDNDTNNKK